MTLDPQPPNIDQLIQDVKRGLEALDELMAWARPWLRAQMSGQPSGNLRARFDESDVVEETLARVLERLRDFQGNTGAEFRAWLNSIGQNKLRDLERQHLADKRDLKKEQPIHDSPDSADHAAAEPPSPGSTPSQHAIGEEDKMRLKEQIDKLSSDHRQVIYLRYWDELEFEEIGQRMGRSADAAKHLYQRALAELRSNLSESDQ